MHWKTLIINFSSCFLTGSDLTCKKVLFSTLLLVILRENFFVDSCVPLHTFDYIYNYLMGTNVSFIDW